MVKNAVACLEVFIDYHLLVLQFQAIYPCTLCILEIIH